MVTFYCIQEVATAHSCKLTLIYNYVWGRKKTNPNSAVPSMVIHQSLQESLSLLDSSKCALNFEMCFRFQNVLSFLKCAFISEMCFHFQKFSLQFSPQFSLQFHFNLYLSFQSNINDDCSCKQVVNRQHTTKTPKPHLFCSLKVDHVRSYTISLKTFRC